METYEDVELTKEQKKQISRVVNRYFRIKRKKFIRELKVWKKFQNN